MNPASLSWSRREKLQVCLVGAAPAVVVGLLALMGAALFGQETGLLAAFVLPLAYGTLFLSVLPALSLLRRYRPETLPNFVFTVAAATFAPWALIYAAYWLITPFQEQPPASLVALTLAAPTLGAALLAIAVWLLGFRAKNAA